MIPPVDEAIPPLKPFSAPTRAGELYNGNLPTACLRRRRGLPEDAPVSPPVDQLSNENSDPRPVSGCARREGTRRE